MNLSNVHDANFATAMELGRRMGMRVPDETDIHIFAVEVMENLTFCERLSPELEEALPELVEEMHGEILDLPRHAVQREVPAIGVRSGRADNVTGSRR